MSAGPGTPGPHDGRQLELSIDNLAAGGDGVARDADGRVTFVARAAPGDRVLARVTQARKSFARADIVTLLRPGPGRIEPRCAAFADRSCGGCQWLHLDYPTQAMAKTELVAGALRKAVARGLDVRPLETPVAELGWRRRARLHWVRPRRANAALVGFYAPGSGRVTDIDRCPQLEPALEEALAEVRRLLAPALTGKGELNLLAGHRGAVQVAIRGPCAPTSAARLAASSSIAGVTLGKQAWGERTIELEPGLPGRADGFAQPSRAGNRALVARVAAATEPRGGARILELYAGSGNFTRTLAEGAGGLIAIDDARPAGPLPWGAAVEFRRGDAAALVAELAAGAGAVAGPGSRWGQGRRRERFDLAVLDPPRAGAAEVLPALISIGPPRIVYVSCDPATLARDLATLDSAGYRAKVAWPIDLMPQTAHVEVVVALERG